ncbi:MAG: metal-dependent hydrolase [Balneolaceae bacterium]|nr:metal-dependent hydrolase [Balneolaceae bacterium]MCH8549777.1 metal-dependent hydrolase [Balneolaceae bacterium]
MDPFTHGIVGAAASHSILKKDDTDKTLPVAATGFVSAMLADLDIFIHMPGDPLFNIEVHRQFTHSLVFIPFGGLFATLLLWFIMRRWFGFKELSIYCTIAYATSGILDAFTSYGTQLLWPFLDTRFAWNVVSVLDPLLTVGLLLLVGLGIWKKRKAFTWAAWGWLALILLFGWFQNERIQNVIHKTAVERGHTATELVVKPTIGNQLLWRANYIHDDRVWTYGVRAGLFSESIVYTGEDSPLIIPERDFAEYEGTTMYNDLKRFSHLSEGFLVRHPDKPEVIGDGRYSMLPTSMIPLWGVETDTTQTDKHLPFLYFRDASDEVRSRFTDMLLGREESEK